MIFKRLRTRIGVPVALMAVLAMVLPAGASADPLGSNTEYSSPDAPIFPMTLVEGSDGNMWFTDPGFPPEYTNLQIGRVTPAGVVTKYTPAGPGGVPASLSSSAQGIADGPDNNVWFTEPGAKKVGHVDPTNPATTLVEISVPGMPTPGVENKSLITAGPDGNLWVTLGVNGIARIKPGGEVTEYTAGLNAGAEICSITAGPDGNVWFGDCGTTKAVGKITPAGSITEYEVAGVATRQPESIVAGSDGRLWFPADKAANERLGAITTSGTVTYYETPTTPAAFSLSSLTAGPDGNIWATESTGANEGQEATLKGEGGTYKLGFEGQETGWTGTGSTTSAGKTITSVTTSTGKVVVGELITGAGIPAESTVSSCTPNCDAPTSIVMSKAATATATGVSLSADLTVKPATSTANVRTALSKLSTIGATANISVSGSGSPPTVIRSFSFTGKFARTNVPQMTCDGSKLTGAGAGCTIETTTLARPSRLFRIKPANPSAMKEFPLKPATSLQSLSRANALASGPGGNVWYTSFEGPASIGKFGTESSEFTLNISKEGSTGDGTVVSSPAGIECGATCSADFAAGTVVLKASPDNDSLFVSWKGCDVGGANGRECKVTGTANQVKNVTAKFVKAYDVSVSRSGTGLGKVGSSPGGVLCLSNCSSTSAKFKELTNVTLTATPSKHFTFTGWSGDCTGTGTCVLSSLSADKAVEAEFAEIAKFDLTVTKTGGGQGTVKAKQAGINCGATCTTMAAKYYQGEVIELLVPVPSKGSTFAGWSGSGCSGTGTCLVTMSEAKSVNAEFK